MLQVLVMQHEQLLIIIMLLDSISYHFHLLGILFVNNFRLL